MMKPTCTIRQAKRRYQSAHWRLLRKLVFERDGWRCRRCGAAGRLECDHVLNWREGGAFWAWDNLQALCRTCHQAKTTAEIQDRDQTWADRLNTL